MDNIVKLIIIVVMIFALIGFAFNSNNTLVKYPSLITTNQISSNSNIISPDEAISIANSNIPAFGEVRYGVTLIQMEQNHIIWLHIQNDPGLKNYGQPLLFQWLMPELASF